MLKDKLVASLEKRKREEKAIEKRQQRYQKHLSKPKEDEYDPFEVEDDVSIKKKYTFYETPSEESFSDMEADYDQILEEEFISG